MTTIMAANPGQVTIQGSHAPGTNLFLGTSTSKVSFVRILGITFEGGGDTFYNTDHI
jgi:hypothetical protein